MWLFRRVGLPASVAFTCIMACTPRTALAQANIGSGPLTSRLSDTEPVGGAIDLGVVTLAPGVGVREIGWDSNVFNEPPELTPKEDWVLSVQPDVAAFSRLRLLQLSGYAGGDFTYYHTYESERSTGYAYRGRADLLLSRLRPFIGGGQTKTRERPNGEIDVRANRREDELSGGLAYDLSDSSLVYASAFTFGIIYDDAFEQGINIGQSLTRDAYNYQAGLRTDLTPLLSLQVYGSYQEDQFTYDPLRDAQTGSVTAAFRFAPDAVVSGLAQISFRDMKFDDPGIDPFRGVTAAIGLSYAVLDVGRLTVNGLRLVDYSYDTAEAYYVEYGASVSYTHRLFSEIDVQGRFARSWFDYEAREGIVPHQDLLDTTGASVGYNLRNRTRMALNYEFQRRRSPAYPERNFDRRRVYFSWQFAL
jgi:hypothetical protein